MADTMSSPLLFQTPPMNLKWTDCGISGRKLQLRRAGSDRRQHGQLVCSLPKQGPVILRLAVAAATELLRGFSSSQASSSPPARTTTEAGAEAILDPVQMITADYARAYFLTGEFTRELYTEQCVFKDPTISFTGRDTYERNLKLLVPFLVDPSLELRSIAEGEEGERNFIIAFWTLRTFINLPWMPLISVDGSTTYDLDRRCRVTKHEERWSIAATQAVRQLLVPSERAVWRGRSGGA